MNALTQKQIIEIKAMLGQRAFSKTIETLPTTRKAANELSKKYLRKGNTVKATEDAMLQLSKHVIEARDQRNRWMYNTDYSTHQQEDYTLPKGTLAERKAKWVASLIAPKIVKLLDAAHRGTESVKFGTPGGKTWTQDGGNYGGRASKYSISVSYFEVTVANDWLTSVYKSGLFHYNCSSKGIVIAAEAIDGNTWQATWLEKAAGRNFKIVNGFIARSNVSDWLGEVEYFLDTDLESLLAARTRKERQAVLAHLTYNAKRYNAAAEGHIKMQIFEDITAEVAQHKELLKSSDLRTIRQLTQQEGITL